MVGVSNIFYFFLLGGGEGGVRGNWEGGRSVFLPKIPGGGGGSPGQGGGGRGAGRVSAENLGGGGLNIFFRGRNAHQGKAFPLRILPHKMSLVTA